MKPVRTISLIYGYSARNAGDFAITLGALDILSAFDFKIKLFLRYTQANPDYQKVCEALKERYGHKLEIFESPFYLNRTDNIFNTLKGYGLGILTLLGIRRQKAFSKALLDCDMVIFNGGNLFRCHSFVDFTRLTALLYPLKIARNQAKPYLIFPQSASKLNIIGKKLLLPILRTASAVMIRECQSYNYLQTMMGNSNFIQTIDLAFFIDKTHLPNISLPYKRRCIAITLRFYTVGDIQLFTDEEIHYCYSMFDKIIEHVSQSHDILIVVQSDKDEETSRTFAIRHNLKVIKTDNVTSLLSIYKKVDLLIGMRLHSMILALSTGTPCIGIFYREWGLKNPGMMEYFNMPYFFMDDRPNPYEIVLKTDLLLSQRSSTSAEILNTLSDEKVKFQEALKTLSCTK